MRASGIFLIGLFLSLSACSKVEEWFADGPDQAPLPGDRIAVLPETEGLKADATLADMAVVVPDAQPMTDWAEDVGGATVPGGNIAYTGSFLEKDSARVGKGESWVQANVPPPVVAGGKLYAMDAEGNISAHDATDLTKILWQSAALADPDGNDIFGGGLTAGDGVLYAVSGRGVAVALNLTSGAPLWQVKIGGAARSAPRLMGGKLYVMTVDNQLIALDAANGQVAWRQRGITETASFLGLATPASDGERVLAAYSSGEIKAVRADSGEEIWSDSLIFPRRTTAASAFTGVNANPIILEGVAIATSTGGLMVANAMANGQRVWEMDISSPHTPWLAGEFLYVLTSNAELACLHARTGRVKWVSPLPRYEDQEKRKHPYSWTGPVMIAGQLAVVGAQGEMRLFKAETGEAGRVLTVPSGVTTPPVVAGNAIYLVTAGAKIYALR